MHNQKIKKPFKKRKFSNATTAMVKGAAKTTAKDVQQDREIQRLKKMIKIAKPPVKSTYIENNLSPENAFEGFTFQYPAKGAAENERIGKQIDIKSVNYRFTLNVSDTDVFDTMRVIFVQWQINNAESAIPSNNLLFLYPVGDYPNLWPFNTQNAHTYRILYDRVFNLSEGGIAQVTENILFTPKDLGITKLTFENDDGGQIPTLAGGLIMGYVCSDSSATPNPRIDYTAKFNFTDS